MRRTQRLATVDLPRRRTSDIHESERFGQLVAAIWRDLREEAGRGMSDPRSQNLKPDSERFAGPSFPAEGSTTLTAALFGDKT